MIRCRRRSVLLWPLVWVLSLGGCAQVGHPAPIPPTAVTRPNAPLPLTVRLRGAARVQYLLGKEIDRTIVAHGDPGLKQVALTFDDGPHGERTDLLLQTLAKLRVHATFFTVGKMIERYPELIQEEILQGHEVGNHTFSHIHVTSLTDPQIAREIFDTNDLIQRYTGEPAVLFRPPGGRLSWGAFRALDACGMVTVMWTDDPKDYVNPGKPDPVYQKLLLKRLMMHIRPGGIILLHDGILDTVAILPAFIHELRAQGYKVGTVTDLLLAQQHHLKSQQVLVRDQLTDQTLLRLMPRTGAPIGVSGAEIRPFPSSSAPKSSAGHAA